MDTFVPKGNISGPILPEFVLKLAITAGAKLLYSVLCSHAYNKDHCWPSYAKLAERLGCSVNSIKNYLKELVGQKLIAVERVSYHSSKFFMLKPSSEMLPEAPTMREEKPLLTASSSNPSNFDGYPSKVGGYEPKVGYLNNLKKDKKENIPTSQSLSTQSYAGKQSCHDGGGDFLSDFERVYAAYPRKEAKGLARGAWLLLVKNKTLPAVEIVLTAIERFQRTTNWQRENGRFIPHLANFLKGERWNDPISDTEQAESVLKAEAAMRQKLHEAEEQKRKEAFEAKASKHKPAFEAFAAKFKGSFHRPMVFGLWLHLAENGDAPLPSEVPDDNQLEIYAFLKNYESRRNRERARAIYNSKAQTDSLAILNSRPNSRQFPKSAPSKADAPVGIGDSIAGLLEQLKQSANEATSPDLACLVA